jgi:phage portal protein BeeE
MQFDLQRALARSGGKALGAHPAFMGTEPVGVYSPGAARQDAKLSDRHAHRHLEAYGGKEAIDHVFKCVDLYATTTAMAEWHLERDGKPLVRERHDDTPKDRLVGPKDLYELLDRPNPFMLYDELVELLIIDVLMVGNGYWYKWRNTADGKPLSLYRLSPAHVKIIPGPFGPKRYEYQPPGAREPLRIEPEDIVHFKLPNPHDAYYGMGVIRKGGRPFDMELAVTETLASYYENRTIVDVVVESERRVPRDVFNKLRAQIRARVSGPGKAGELLVLESGLKASSLSANARDALFDTIAGMSEARIYSMFKASPLLFGEITDAAGGIKPSDVRREFDTYVLRPFMDKLQRRITEHLAAAWGVKFCIDYRYIMGTEELLKQGGVVSAVPGITVREVRRYYMPLGIFDSESTGDEEIDETVLNMPMPELDENGQGGGADRNLPGEAGRPPLGKNTRSLGVARKSSGKALESPTDVLDDLSLRLALAADRVRIENAGKKPEGKAKMADGANISIGRKLDNEQRPQDTLASMRTQEVDGVTAFMRAALDEAAVALERELLDHVEGKAFKRADLVTRINKSTAWAAFRDKVRAILEEGSVRAASASTMHHAQQGVIPDDEVDYDAIAKRVANRPEGVNGIVKNFKKRLTAYLANQMGEDATQRDAERIVRERINTFRNSEVEAIALTEATHAYNETTLDLLELTGATEVYVEDGDDHDQPCIDANGSVWPIDHARQHRLEHPRCRRAFLGLTAEAA